MPKYTQQRRIGSECGSRHFVAKRFACNTFRDASHSIALVGCYRLFACLLALILFNFASAAEEDAWIPLLQSDHFDSTWKKTNFGGEGSVDFQEGVLTLGFGQPMTGIHYVQDNFPKERYEVQWKAKRLAGQDFFAGVTMPIGDEFFSFIVGGWGGGLVGISSIDGRDASDNDTGQFEQFENDRWYDFRVRVDSTHLKAWINDKEMVSVLREGKRFGLRMEVRASRPLGYACFQCKAAVKDFKYRLIQESANKNITPTKSADSSEKPIFFRVNDGSNGQSHALQTAIASYEIQQGKFKGAKVDLIGAVHVGEKQYYRALNEKFLAYDSLLFELVADPKVRFSNAKKDKGVYNPVSAMQVGMKEALQLAFQLDEIDYQAKNFVHADMSPDEFIQDMKKRDDGFLSMFARVLGSSIAAQGVSQANGSDAKLLAALASENRSVALRRVMADQFATMDIQLSGIADSDGKSTLLTERNRKAMEVLQKELEKGKRKIGIFYGAAHLDDMHVRMLRDFHAAATTVEWLDAWKLSE